MKQCNPDGGNPELGLGIMFVLPEFYYKFEYRIYKNRNDDELQLWWNTDLDPWPPPLPPFEFEQLANASGDFDFDGLDELIVIDYPVVRLFDYSSGTMEETWSFIAHQPKQLGAINIRQDQYNNFILVDGPTGIWEEERLADAYSNKSLDASSTWPNSARHLLQGGGKLHEQFTSGGEIFYRRSSNNGTSWELTKRISSGNGSNNAGCLTVAHANSLHLVWQRQIASDRYEVWYSRSTDNGSSWTTPVILPNANNVQVSYWQAGGAMPVIAEVNLIPQQEEGGELIPQYKLVVVYCSISGLRYRTSVNNGATWTIPTPSDIISGLYNDLVWYPSLASGDNFLSLTYDYRPTQSGLYSRVYNGSTWSSETHVADVTGTVYNRHSSVAVDPDGHPITAWCAQKYVGGQLDIDYRILFRYGDSNNTWNPWFVEFAKIQGVHSFYPSITYYNKGGINPYGINIVHHTFNQSTSAQTVRLKKYVIGNTWIDTLLSSTGAWANSTLENYTSGVPKNLWTDQSASPYLITLSSQFLPKLVAEGEAVATGRRVVVQHRQTRSFVAFELADMHLLLSDGSEVPVLFKAHDFRQPLNPTLANVWDYLGTDPVQLPANAVTLVFNKSIYSNIPADTTGQGFPQSFPSRQFRFRIHDPNGGGVLATIDTGAISGVVSVNISNFAGQRVILRSAVTLAGVPSPQVAIGVGDVITIVESTQRGDLASAAKFPVRHGLDQNYPNPFNPITTIRYAVPRGVHVNLTIYDILGREVATLVNEFKGAGFHEVNFDATRLSSGVYFYRLNTGDLIEVKKMLIAK